MPAHWNHFLWNSGAVWVPAVPSLPPNLNQRPKTKTMKRQQYYPAAIGNQPEWLMNFARRLLEHGEDIGLTTDSVNGGVADALYLAYAYGTWMPAVRGFGPGSTTALETLATGTGSEVYVLPTFIVPALPPANPPLPATVAVLPGALDRIFLLVKEIKAKPLYTEELGQLMGIVGGQDSTENPVPTFTLKVERSGDGCEVVKIIFRKYGRPGVAIYSRRGGGAWELLAIDLASPYLDARPLLVATTPETREYRLQYYEAEAPVGEFTAIASVSVAP